MSSDLKITERPGPGPSRPEGWDFDAWGEDDEGNVYHQLYGAWWPLNKRIDLTYINLECFREGRTPEEGGLGKFGHLQECIEFLFNHGGKTRFEWNPWAEQMMRQCCETYEISEFLAVSGCSSSGKSHSGAAWIWVNWLADPENTLGMVTSTSIAAAKRRIWKSMVQLYTALPKHYKALVKHRPSLNMFQYIPANGSTASDASSISLVAAEPRQEAAAASKLIGQKNNVVILIADELAELSPAILSAAVDNLVSNPVFHMVAMSNPKDREDSFGVMSEPLAGWDSINEVTYEWPTKYGRAIRFDALQSPNYLEREIVYRYMLTYDKIEKARTLRGENSPHFYRFFRGFFPIQGAEDVLYSEVDFSAWLKDKIEWGKVPPIKVAGLDPSYSSGGDLTILSINLYGKDKNGLDCFQFEEDIPIKENAQDKTTPRSDQIWNQVKGHLDQRGIEYKNLGVDSTGAGGPFCDRGSQLLSHEFLRVEFGGKASSMQVSARDRTEAFKKYANKVSEIWSVAREFLRGGQIAGLRKSVQVMSQLKARRYETIKSGDGERIRVESKRDMKARTGRSPDNVDGLFVSLALCRERYHFRSEERGMAVLPDDDYLKILQKFDVVTLSNRGQPEWQAAG